MKLIVALLLAALAFYAYQLQQELARVKTELSDTQTQLTDAQGALDAAKRQVTELEKKLAAAQRAGSTLLGSPNLSAPTSGTQNQPQNSQSGQWMWGKTALDPNPSKPKH